MPPKEKDKKQRPLLKCFQELGGQTNHGFQLPGGFFKAVKPPDHDPHLHKISTMLANLNNKDPYFLGETQSAYVRVRSSPCLTKVHLKEMEPPIDKFWDLVAEEGNEERREEVITCCDRDRRDRFYLNTFGTFVLSPTRKKKVMRNASLPVVKLPRLFPALMKVTDQA